MHITEGSEKRVIDSPAPNSVRCSNSRSADAAACPALVPNESKSDPHGNPGSHKSETMCDSIAKQPAFDHVAAHVLFKHTRNRLHTLLCRVCEGKCVDEASEFARWVRMSGVLDVLRAFEFQSEIPGDLVVLPEAVDKLCGEIIFECEQFWKRNPRGPWVSLSELEAVNRKLDRIAAQVNRLSPPQTVETAVAGGPALHVIEGGMGA